MRGGLVSSNHTTEITHSQELYQSNKYEMKCAIFRRKMSPRHRQNRNKWTAWHSNILYIWMKKSLEKEWEHLERGHHKHRPHYSWCGLLCMKICGSATGWQLRRNFATLHVGWVGYRPSTSSSICIVPANKTQKKKYQQQEQAPAWHILYSRQLFSLHWLFDHKWPLEIFVFQGGSLFFGAAAAAPAVVFSAGFLTSSWLPRFWTVACVIIIASQRYSRVMNPTPAFDRSAVNQKPGRKISKMLWNSAFLCCWFGVRIILTKNIELIKEKSNMRLIRN